MSGRAGVGAEALGGDETTPWVLCVLSDTQGETSPGGREMRDGSAEYICWAICGGICHEHGTF